jgi:hypothetical protein
MHANRLPHVSTVSTLFTLSFKYQAAAGSSVYSHEDYCLKFSSLLFFIRRVNHYTIANHALDKIQFVQNRKSRCPRDAINQSHTSKFGSGSPTYSMTHSSLPTPTHEIWKIFGGA